ncbi:Oidioi.mRNA.OKI2018_I69.chr2.g5352.t1.cds [Oikopleura dioica]|uniref:Oidioi.mRNA.OKI2018_I69.chr2.g5352.t1.cds n=1 Tax=Oikopleura dioica TaxID=34765 RepID=A0ABN7T6P0_OIKDI|nr:Oidioi.mRNA.OKI2018_I69.chr2.g5352.t1.cds [Oikopleura dioica]
MGPPPDRPQEKTDEEAAAEAEEINDVLDEVKSTTERLLKEILEEIVCINKATHEGDLGAAYEEEWKYAATVFDRTMAYFYILAIIILLISTLFTRFWLDTSPVTSV